MTLLEPNERLGKKLNITGKGRCNVTNDAGCEELLANVPQNGRFLYSAFSRFDGRGTMAFFEELGVPLKVERGRRVFPVSDRAFDVSAALERELRRLRVTLVRDRAVCVLTDETGAVRGVKGEKGTYPAQAVDAGDRRRELSGYRLDRRGASHGGDARSHSHAAHGIARAASRGRLRGSCRA